MGTILHRLSSFSVWILSRMFCFKLIFKLHDRNRKEHKCTYLKYEILMKYLKIVLSTSRGTWNLLAPVCLTSYWTVLGTTSSLLLLPPSILCFLGHKMNLLANKQARWGWARLAYISQNFFLGKGEAWIITGRWSSPLITFTSRGPRSRHSASEGQKMRWERIGMLCEVYRESP